MSNVENTNLSNPEWMVDIDNEFDVLNARVEAVEGSPNEKALMSVSGFPTSWTIELFIVTIEVDILELIKKLYIIESNDEEKVYESFYETSRNNCVELSNKLVLLKERFEIDQEKID